MVKSELINKITNKISTFSDKDVELSANQIIYKMTSALSSGERIEIRGFGSFSLHYRPPRRAHNPKTGEKVVTIPKYSPHFKPGKELRNRINDNRHLPIIDDTE